MTPSTGDVLIGCGAVIAACLAGAFAVQATRSSRNWLYLICVAGCVAFVAGIVGQRVWPSDDAIRAAQSAGRDPQQSGVGPWDAGVRIPVVGTHVTPVAIGGLLVAVAGLSLVLFFEPATPTRPEAVEEGVSVLRPRRRPAFEDDDAV